MTARDPWTALRRHTAARIALGRAGASLPTAEWLRFAAAHAAARDAVHAALDADSLTSELQAHDFAPTLVESAAPERAAYLRRPDLGRRLSQRSAELLRSLPRADFVVVIGDGLSALAVQRHALPLLLALRAQVGAIDAVLVARQARVALGDDAGALLQAEAVLMLIGERPGLSSPDSLGAYLTWSPRPGTPDALRNCVSNIRPEGLPFDDAAHRIAWLLHAARRLGRTGTALKDESGSTRHLPE